MSHWEAEPRCSRHTRRHVWQCGACKAAKDREARALHYLSVSAVSESDTWTHEQLRRALRNWDIPSLELILGFPSNTD
jgi:hypothetical protein